MIARDGRTVWFRSLGIASRGERGSVVWHGVVFDVTATKLILIEQLTQGVSVEPEG